MKCYFAHPFSHENHPDKKRLIQILKDRDLEVIDPFVGERAVNIQFGHREYYSPFMKDRFGAGVALWDKDMKQLTKCDMLVVWLPQPSIGCSIELWEAFRQHKFIQIISEIEHPAFAYILKNGRNQQYKDVDYFEHYRRMKW